MLKMLLYIVKAYGFEGLGFDQFIFEPIYYMCFIKYIYFNFKKMLDYFILVIMIPIPKDNIQVNN